MFPRKMAVSFTRLPWWLWGGKEQESTVSAGSLNSSLDLDLGLREPDTLKFPSVKGGKMASSSRRTKQKWKSREERRIDRECDVVLVPSNGGCLSGSESDDSDWSIGWLEPHAPDFLSDDETENSFAVLVPCYGRGRKELVQSSKNQLWGAIGNLSNEYYAELSKNNPSMADEIQFASRTDRKQKYDDQTTPLPSSAPLRATRFSSYRYAISRFNPLLLLRLTIYVLLDGSQNKLDYVLALTVENFLERRLQTLVFKSGMAKSIHHARVLIRHTR
ncbi:hypothetical protein HHK36_030764 [Tetracentron sinense]|uniref:Ribosomal protein S4 n=1 Tax=Tetracentron sinense TaxID=13715 RepID=A0A834YC95_TETSI|nr:hypothetical protein HHK36_030764 [Tetracentron sinense]